MISLLPLVVDLVDLHVGGAYPPPDQEGDRSQDYGCGKHDSHRAICPIEFHNAAIKV